MAVSLRAGVKPEDRIAVRRLVASTGFFSGPEEEIAVELVDDALAKGEGPSGYHFIFAEENGQAVGYVCFGPIAGTTASHDLYWIVVDNARRGVGVGRRLEQACAEAVRALGRADDDVSGVVEELAPRLTRSHGRVRIHDGGGVQIGRAHV